MENFEVAKQIQRLHSLINKAIQASSDDISLQGHWARYLCVMVAGLIENGLKEIISEYINSKTHKPIANYSISYLTKFQNPKAEKVMELIGLFKAEWRHDLEAYLNNEGRKDAIDSIMNNRNQIAHGKDVGITVVSVKNYLDKVISVLEFIEVKFK